MRLAILIAECKVHNLVIQHFLLGRFEVVTLSRDDVAMSRNQKWQAINKEGFDVLITSGQSLGEGTDNPQASALLMVYPFNLLQYLGLRKVIPWSD